MSAGDALEIVPSGAALCAEVRGIDLGKVTATDSALVSQLLGIGACLPG